MTGPVAVATVLCRWQDRASDLVASLFYDNEMIARPPFAACDLVGKVTLAHWMPRHDIVGPFILYTGAQL